jgi:hypothetical protein
MSHWHQAFFLKFLELGYETMASHLENKMAGKSGVTLEGREMLTEQ